MKLGKLHSKKNFIFIFIFFSFFATSCATLHHYQVGNINQSEGELEPFSVKLSSVGFDLSGTVEIASVIAEDYKSSQRLEEAAALLSLFNMGPVTGNPVYDENYAKKIAEYVYKACPSGKMTGLTSVREATTVGTISGEFVRIDGYCIK